MNVYIFALLSLVVADNNGLRVSPIDPTTVEIAPVRVRRWVRQHSCMGIYGDGADSIGCMETHTAALEHMLTPTEMWCNDKTCVSEFNETYAVHTIRCTPSRCAVMLHCEEAFNSFVCSVALTVFTVLLLMLRPHTWAAASLRDALARRRTLYKQH